MAFKNVDFYCSYGISSQLPESERPEVAFAGRSNVGKSSLINKLLNRKALARVSSVPGKTATINFYTANEFYLVDLPGYGYAKVGKQEKYRWSELIEGYYAQDRNFTLTVLLIDMRHAPSALDKQMVDFLVQKELPFIVVLTKADKLNKTETTKMLSVFAQEIPYFDQITVIPASVQSGAGIEELRSILEEVTVVTE
jgi:GTP-binding protein